MRRDKGGLVKVIVVEWKGMDGLCFDGRAKKHWIRTLRKRKESRVIPIDGLKELGKWYIRKTGGRPGLGLVQGTRVSNISSLRCLSDIVRVEQVSCGIYKFGVLMRTWA